MAISGQMACKTHACQTLNQVCNLEPGPVQWEARWILVADPQRHHIMSCMTFCHVVELYTRGVAQNTMATKHHTISIFPQDGMRS